MALRESQQLHEIFKRSAHPLIVLPDHADVDHFAAAFGLSRALKKLDKEAVIVATPTVPESLRRLGATEEVHNDIPTLHDLVIELSLGNTELESVTHERNDGKVTIHIAPKAGTWKAEQVAVRPDRYRYDLVIAIGGEDVTAYGRLYRDYADFFYHTPLVNIDHSPANEHFGHLNIVDITATSCGEVCHDLLIEMDPALLDPEMATLFLTGMIAKTKSFKSRTVTPKTLSIASRLLEEGARREDVIHHLYRTRSVATLRLWGRALARLKHDESHTCVWTLLSHQDFLHAGADEAELPQVIDELVTTAPEAQTALLLYEMNTGAIGVVLKTMPPRHAADLLSPLHPVGNAEEARAVMANKTLLEAEQEVLTLLQR